MKNQLTKFQWLMLVVISLAGSFIFNWSFWEGLVILILIMIYWK